MTLQLRVTGAVLAALLSVPAVTAAAQPRPAWYTSDFHVHANGCGGAASTSSLLTQLRDGGVNVGHILIWGGSVREDATNFIGQMNDPISDGETILHWDIEISFLPGHENGHMILLNIGQLDTIEPFFVRYPGRDYLLPNYDWAHAQGGLVGYAHGGQWTAGSFEASGAGADGPLELPLDVVLETVDFLSTERVESDGFRWLWYSMLDAGFQIPPAIGSDYLCLRPIGSVQTVVALPPGAPLTFDAYIDAVRAGRTVIRNGGARPDELDIRVNEAGLGSSIRVAASSLPVSVEVDARSARPGALLELVRNGQVIETAVLTDELTTYRWSVGLERSSWVAARTSAAHTAATYVLIDGCPIRNDPAAARAWIGYLDSYLDYGVRMSIFGGSVEMVRARVEEAKGAWERIALEGEGTLAPSCEAEPDMDAGVAGGDSGVPATDAASDASLVDRVSASTCAGGCATLDDHSNAGASWLLLLVGLYARRRGR